MDYYLISPAYTTTISTAYTVETAILAGSDCHIGRLSDVPHWISVDSWRLGDNEAHSVDVRDDRHLVWTIRPLETGVYDPAGDKRGRPTSLAGGGSPRRRPEVRIGGVLI